MSDLAGAVGGVLKRLRLSRSLTQAEFAALVGLHETYVSNLERGQRSPNMDTLARVSSALGIRLSDLLRESEDALGGTVGAPVPRKSRSRVPRGRDGPRQPRVKGLPGNRR